MRNREEYRWGRKRRAISERKRKIKGERVNGRRREGEEGERRTLEREMEKEG